MTSIAKTLSMLCLAAGLAFTTTTHAARLDLWGTGASVEVADCTTNRYGECTGIQGNWRTVYEEANLRSRSAGAEANNDGFAQASVVLGASIDQLRNGMEFQLVVMPHFGLKKVFRSSAWLLQGIRYTGDTPTSLTVDPQLLSLVFSSYWGSAGVQGEMYVYDADALEAVADPGALPDPTLLGLQPLAGVRQERRPGDAGWDGNLLSPVSFDVQPGDEIYFWLRASAFAGGDNMAFVGSATAGGSGSGSLDLVITGGPIDLIQPPTAVNAPAPVPLPDAIWLALGGLAGLIAAGRRA